MISVEMRAIAGFEGIYSVTSDGRVYSHARVTSHGRQLKGRFFKPQLNREGYHQLNLYGQGRLVSRTVHRLVAEAFISNPDGLATVNHKDGVKSNNRVENLEWMSVGDNIRHAWATGLRDGRPLSDAHKASVSAANKRRTMSDAHKSAIIASNKRRTISDETKAAIGAASKGRTMSDANKAALLAGQKRRWAEWRTSKQQQGE